MRLNAHWGMLPPDAFQHVGDRRIKPQGGGSPGPTQSTAYNTNIPEYAKPYVMNMLGAGQNQLFTTTPGTTDAEGNVTPGEITGFRPYQAYSSNPADYFAGPSSLQTSAYNAAANLQSPSQYQVGTSLAGAAGLGQLGTAGQAGMYGAQGAGLGQLGAMAAMPAFGAGQQYASQVTNPNAVQSYMSPYQQSVTDVAKTAALREAQMANNAANLASARSGTYGGARQALAQAERERGLLANLSNIQAQGSQSAYDRAIQAQQFGANLGLQGITTGLQGISAGQQGVSQGLQGIGAQQAAYSGAGQAASTLGQLGTAQQQADVSNIGLQNQLGQQQQQYQQGIINQAVQDYATAQQYPYMQLSMMSNLLRGLPMQNMTTQQYQAQAPVAQQAAGLLGAYGAYKGAFKEGGAVVPGYKSGVLARVDNTLDDLADAGGIGALKKRLAETSSPKLREEIQDKISELSGIATANVGKLGTNMAGGGIIAFDEGGDVPRFDGEYGSYVDPAGNIAYGDSNYSVGDMFHGLGTWGRSLIGLPEYVDFAEQEREKKRKALAEKAKESEDKGDGKPPVPPAAAPAAAAPASNVPPGTSINQDPMKYLGARQDMYRALGIEPGVGERGKKLLEYYDKSLGGLKEQGAEASRFNKALAFLEAGQDARGLLSGATTGGKAFLKGEAEIQKQQRAREQALMEAGEKVESGQRKEAKGDIDGAMKDYADARRDLTSIRTAEINAAAHGATDRAKEERVKKIQDDYKAKTGKDLSYTDALAELTRVTTTAEGTAEARARIAANTAYEKWEAGLFMSHPDLVKKARDGDKKAIAELNKVKEDKYQELLKRASPDRARPDAGGPSEIAKGYETEFQGKRYRFKGGDRYDKSNWEAV